jgi:tetratricopeptide (TPR) repeat protein
MRLVPARTIAIEIPLACSLALCVFAASSLPPRIIAQNLSSPSSARERMHQSDQWEQIQQHLPDPATATPQALEQQADILRARRFPDDAMDFYKSALARGGNVPSILNKLGLIELEMKNLKLARAYFQRVVKISRKDAEAWNNLGAVEFLDGASGSAVSDYKRAIKLEKHEAVFHANLATAYFETKDYGGARRELAAALKIDPQVFDQQGIGGITAHVLSSEERARFSFEMAKLYAQNGLEEQMLHSLATASESGMDVQREMRHDAILGKFAMDPRVLVLVHNAQLMRAGHAAAISTSSPAALPASAKPVAD